MNKKNTNARSQRNKKEKKNPQTALRVPKPPRINLLRDAWMATLLNPFAVHGVRIPDEVTTPSATCSFRQRLTIHPVQDGSTGNYSAGIYFSPTLFNTYAPQVSYNSTTGALGYGAVNSFSGYTTAVSLIREYRVVSAGIAVTSTNAMAQNQGRNICTYYAGNDKTQPVFGTAITAVNIPSLLIAENSDDSPINTQMQCTAVWTPSDRSNYAYHGVDYSALVDPSTNIKYYNPGIFVWCADGISSSASFEVTLVLNIEYIPLQNTISFIPLMPSRYDVSAMQRALNNGNSGRIFGTVDSQSVNTAYASSNFGLSAMAGQLLSNFGSGISDVLLPYTRSFARAITTGAIGYASSRYTNRMPLQRGLLGLDI